MPSEYDFLATYSRRLRRVVTLAMVTGAVLAGVFAMGLIIALPLQSRSNSEMERATNVSPPRIGRSLPKGRAADRGQGREDNDC